MAVGFPTKVSYVDGDVFSASDINDTNGTINLLTSSTLSYSAGKNAIINGGMDIWQRGTSITGTSGIPHTADRWQVTRVGATGYTTTRQSSGATLPEIQYCLRAQRDSGNSNTTLLGAFYSVESVNSIPFAGKATTLSFYVRKGADYSGGALTVEFSQGTGTDQNIISGGFTGKTNVGTSSVTLTTSWQRVTITGTVATTTTQLGLQFYYTPTGTAGAADFFELTGVQVEYGSTPTSFARTGGTIQGELAACQRYFQRLFNGAEQQFENLGLFQCTSSSAGTGAISFLVPMRVSPTLSVSSASHFSRFDATAGSLQTLTSFTFFQTSPRRTRLNLGWTSGTTAGNATDVLMDNTSGTMDASAEL
jgi:hypothetical protein